jgi:predicted XRE-type DNA-binding protein
MLDDPIAPLKRQLADEILTIAKTLDFFIAASLLELDPSRLSDLRRGRVERFSVERLIRILATVDRRVDVTVSTIDRPERRWSKVLRERRKKLTT